MTRPGRAWALALLVASIAPAGPGCVRHYKVRTEPVRGAYEAGETETALAKLDEVSEDARLDRLLVLLDRGMLLHVAGRYAESIEALAEAERLSDERETVFLRDEAGRRKLYRTSELEKQLIQVTQALNFAALGDHDSARVEVRRIDQRLRHLAGERRHWDRLAIARYVGGVLYEQGGDPGAAYIDYAMAHRIGANRALGEPLVRLSRVLGREEDHRRMTAIYPHAPLEGPADGEGEIVLVIAAGLAPERAFLTREIGPPNDRITQEYLDYAPRPWVREAAVVSVAGIDTDAATLTSLEELAALRGPMAWVEDTERRGTYMASWGHLLLFCLCPPVGLVTTTVHAADKSVMALQTWLSLPAEYQVARLRLPAGEHVVEVGLGDDVRRHTVIVSPGEIHVLSTRLYGRTPDSVTE